MPYRVEKKDNVYKLFNLTKKEYVKVNFKTKETAISAGKNYMRYRKEEPILKGNKIIPKRIQNGAIPKEKSLKTKKKIIYKY